MSINFAELTLGEEIASANYNFSRDTLVRYAGASLDFNPIHYRDDFAESVGLPGVIAHGMLTMGTAASVVTDWLGDSGVVLDYRTRFTKPVPVDTETGAQITITATVGTIDSEAKTARFDLKVLFGELTILGRAQILVKF